MSDMINAVIAGFTILVMKHTLADFFLQTPYQVFNKGRYGHPGGILHAAIHVVLTLPVFLVLAPPSALVVGLIIVGEFLVHYHVDWLKEKAVKRFGWTVDEAGFWRALGVDQLLHLLTYIAIIALLVH